MSTEKSVRVRVKVYDNTTSIYSQDIEISNGEGTFVVPAILADSDIIALQVNNHSVCSPDFLKLQKRTMNPTYYTDIVSPFLKPIKKFFHAPFQLQLPQMYQFKSRFPQTRQ